MRHISFLTDEVQESKEKKELSVLEDPTRFIAIIKTVDYPVRRDKSPAYSWKTRFVRCNGLGSDKETIGRRNISRYFL